MESIYTSHTSAVQYLPPSHFHCFNNASGDRERAKEELQELLGKVASLIRFDPLLEIEGGIGFEITSLAKERAIQPIPSECQPLPMEAENVSKKDCNATWSLLDLIKKCQKVVADWIQNPYSLWVQKADIQEEFSKVIKLVYDTVESDLEHSRMQCKNLDEYMKLYKKGFLQQDERAFTQLIDLLNYNIEQIGDLSEELRDELISYIKSLKDVTKHFHLECISDIQQEHTILNKKKEYVVKLSSVLRDVLFKERNDQDEISKKFRSLRKECIKLNQANSSAMAVIPNFLKKWEKKDQKELFSHDHIEAIQTVHSFCVSGQGQLTELHNGLQEIVKDVHTHLHDFFQLCQRSMYKLTEEEKGAFQKLESFVYICRELLFDNRQEEQVQEWKMAFEQVKGISQKINSKPNSSSVDQTGTSVRQQPTIKELRQI